VSHAFNALIGPHIDKRLARTLHKRWLPPVTAPKPRRGSDTSQLPIDRTVGTSGAMAILTQIKNKAAEVHTLEMEEALTSVGR